MYKNTPKWLPEWSQKAPGGSPGTLLESTLFLTTFFHRIWLPCGLHFGSLLASILDSFLINFLNALPERPWPVLAQMLEPFGLHFGTFLGRFLGYLATAKTVKNQRENTLFQGSEASKNTFFPTRFLRRLRDTPWDPFLLVLGRFWVHFGVPWGTHFSSFVRTFF